MKNLFKVGDKVRALKSYSGAGINPLIEGNVYTVKSIHGGTIKINLDFYGYSEHSFWNESWFELVEETELDKALGLVKSAGYGITDPVSLKSGKLVVFEDSDGYIHSLKKVDFDADHKWNTNYKVLTVVDWTEERGIKYD